MDNVDKMDDVDRVDSGTTVNDLKRLAGSVIFCFQTGFAGVDNHGMNLNIKPFLERLQIPLPRKMIRVCVPTGQLGEKQLLKQFSALQYAVNVGR